MLHLHCRCMFSLLSAFKLLLIAALCSVSHANGRSVFWEPYTPDGHTAVLCHFDGRQEVSIGELLDEGLEVGDDALGGLGLNEDAGGRNGDEGTTASDVFMTNVRVPLLGACEEVADEGRFGGSLRLTGGDGRLGVKGNPGRGWAIEAWFKTAALPEDGAALFDVSNGAVRISLLPDGRLEARGLRGAEPVLTEWRCEPEEWFHLGLVWQPTAFHGDSVRRGELQVCVDGMPVLRSGEQPAHVFHSILGRPVTVGNTHKGESGFNGWIDELRLSSTARTYYALNLDWVDGEGNRPETTGRPYFRDAESLLFRTSFDGTLAPADNPQAARLGTGIPTDAAALAEHRKGWAFAFGDGVSKEALLLKTGKQGVRYENLSVAADQGSIAFWIRPQNWDNAKLWNRFANFKQEFAPVFRVEQDGKKLVAVTWIKTPDNDNYRNPVDFSPGQWQHLVLTWQDGKIARVYLNGKPWSHWGTVQWHYDRKVWDPAKPVSLILPAVENAVYLDDFRVYKRPLAPSEAANLAALYDHRAKLTPLPDYDYIKDVNGVFGTAKVKLWPLLKEYKRVQSATLTLSPAGEDTVLGTARVEVSPDQPFDLEVKAEPFGFGDYTLTVKSFDQAGAELNTFTIPHTRVKPPWWECRAGISDKVMPDWEPVVVLPEGGRRKEEAGSDRSSVIGDLSAEDPTGLDGHRLEPTGTVANAAAVIGITLRDIHFADSGLPAKVVSAGRDILAGPVELMATVDGKDTVLKSVPGSFHAETKGEVRADFSGKSTAGGVTADVQGYVEFDGFMWFEVTLSDKSDKSDELQRLQLQVPYNADAANLLHAWGGESWFRDPRNVRIMEIPEAPGTVFSSLDKKLIRTVKELRGNFMPYAFLTGGKRGMAWFAENDKGWTQSTETPALSIERQENGNVVLTLNIISEEVDLTTSRTFAFGLHPTPVKKLDPTWRGWNWWTVSPDSFCGFGMKGENPASTQFNRFPESWDLARERFDGAVSWGQKEPGNHPINKRVRGIYYDLRGIGSPPEDAKEWWGDWYGYGWGKGNDTLRYTPECIDFLAYYHNEWVRRGLAYGIYMDDLWNSPQKVVPGPAAYLLPDGHMQPGFEWRNQRESLKRMRQIYYENGLTPHMCVHLTHTQYPMWLSFFDEMYDGEDHDLRPAGHPTDFMDYWTPFRLRFHNSQKFGIPPYFHGWVGNNMKDNMGTMPTWVFQQQRAYAGALLVHDLGWLNREKFAAAMGETWHKWVGPNMLTRPENVLVPYWSHKPVAPDAPDGLYVTAWKRDGWCAVAIANWSKKRVEAQLTLDLEAMGFGGIKPEDVQMRDVDANLITYFDDDVTMMPKPKITEVDLMDDGMDDDLADLTLEEPPTLEERKAADPDRKSKWIDGVLQCPVRPHDFRLFEFRTAEK